MSNTKTTPARATDHPNAASDATRYRWDDLAVDRPMEKIARRRIVGKRMMISQVTLDRGFFVPSHSHENEQISVVLSGRMRFVVGEAPGRTGREIIVEAGEALHLPSNVPHAAEALEDSLLLDLFSPPSEKTGVDKTTAPAVQKRKGTADERG